MATRGGSGGTGPRGGRPRRSAPPPLDADERAAWVAFYEATVRAEDALERQLQRDSGLSLADYEILVMLSEAPEGHLTMSELADRALLSASRLTYRVDRLADRGWVERRPCPTDGRRVWAVLTPEGLRKLEASYPGHLEAVRRFVIDPMGRDTRALTRALHRMRDALDDADDGAGAPAG